MWLDLIALTAGLLGASCFVPQIAHTIRTQSADDVSLMMLWLTLASIALYEIYATALELWPVVVTNGLFGLLVIVELVLKHRYARQQDETPPNNQG